MKIKTAMFFLPVTALSVLILLVIFLSDTPLQTLYFFFLGPFGNIFSFSNMINMSIPLIIGALGISIAMKAGHLNLGGEGQIYLGAFVTTAAALELSGLGVFGAVLAVLLGCLCSGSAAAFCGFLKAKWNTSELIATFLMSAAIIPVVNYLVTVPFLDIQGSLVSTKKIDESLRLPFFSGFSYFSTGILIAFVTVIIVQIFLTKTKLGYEFRMAGGNENFARYGGINTKLNTVTALGISGAFYGLAGSVAVLGVHHAVIKEFSAGLGWNALAVALIAKFNPPFVIPAAFFFAWIGAGARAATQNTGVSLEISSIVQAVIFLLATCNIVLSKINIIGNIKTKKQEGGKK